MTSFPVSPAKQKDLAAKMAELEIDEADLVEEFIRGSGAGGQKINKTSVVVQLIHQPSKIIIRCQQSRSQALNRYYARKMLVEKLEEKIKGEASAKQKQIEKIRRQKRKRSKRAKEKILAAKKHRSQTKTQRKKPSVPTDEE